MGLRPAITNILFLSGGGDRLSESDIYRRQILTCTAGKILFKLLISDFQLASVWLPL